MFTHKLSRNVEISNNISQDTFMHKYTTLIKQLREEMLNSILSKFTVTLIFFALLPTLSK